MAKIFVGRLKVESIGEDYLDCLLVEGPDVRPWPDGVRDVLSYFSIFPPRKDGDWV